MVPLGFLDRYLGLRDRRLMSLALPSPSRLLPSGARFHAASALSLERQCGLAGCLIVDLAGQFVF
jgi:hypothetical protein